MSEEFRARVKQAQDALQRENVLKDTVPAASDNQHLDAIIFVVNGRVQTHYADEPIIRAITLVYEEWRSATSKHRRFNSAHEGFAVIDEERDELWDEVKKNPRKHVNRGHDMYAEAKQLAAMALRFMCEVAR